ncbi:MAG TPA: FlgD immunoglobulin-like domain containing protein [candidate division Zixibacteria bacterium]|nr:T9SS type A sorting domain-containing protein [candidate division Zixibacteria bacterium]MDD4917643.1 FlgD immunoglobulin-like domain containing protein [candidate division Zixibacteria bacterium]MDM7974047.1 FlgD immunoglobulin-like domain containing protein [candidate division Zixibacteria bacterium]HOD65539.1 FlgD immunoglobulin-like domain containing protein [candidate division Zixibacteria bacterium]HPI31907.1 FlgD immunoglobulin-like domain containing protein [candidate division Zixiba
MHKRLTFLPVLLLAAGVSGVQGEVNGTLVCDELADTLLGVSAILWSISDFAEPVYSLEIEACFDPACVRIRDVDYTASLVAGWGEQFVDRLDADAGTFALAVAGTLPLAADSGTVFRLTLAKAAGLPPPVPVGRVTRFRINETSLVSTPPGGGETPRGYDLAQNYPNPFNPGTTIRFALGRAEAPVVSIYNQLGQVVRRDHLGPLPPGPHVYVWDGTDERGRPVAGGVYLYRLETANFTRSKKMILVK